MAGASPAQDDVLIVADPGYERRYYYSADRAASIGTGYMGQGELKVYRLDVEASQSLTAAIKAELKSQESQGQWDGHKAKWSKQALNAFRTLIQTTGIRRS